MLLRAARHLGQQAIANMHQRAPLAAFAADGPSGESALGPAAWAELRNLVPELAG